MPEERCYPHFGYGSRTNPARNACAAAVSSLYAAAFPLQRSESVADVEAVLHLREEGSGGDEGHENGRGRVLAYAGHLL